MIATAIITAPRPVTTIEQSLRSYAMAGFTDQPLFIHSDGQDESWSSPVMGSIIVNKTKLGNLRNWNEAAKTLLRYTTEPWLMICEDDITWARNACDVLQHDLAIIKHEAIGAVSLYCPQRMAKLIEQAYPSANRVSGLAYGWYRVAIGRKMWGAQCLVFKREWLEKLLGHPTWCGVIADLAIDKNVDAWIAQTIWDMDRTILYRIPCLVDHTLGDRNSSLYGDRDRPELRTRYFRESV